MDIVKHSEPRNVLDHLLYHYESEAAWTGSIVCIHYLCRVWGQLTGRRERDHRVRLVCKVSGGAHDLIMWWSTVSLYLTAGGGSMHWRWSHSILWAANGVYYDSGTLHKGNLSI